MISIEKVTKRYDRAVALNNISFEVHKGQIVGFLGPNGAGKTTTMKILTAYLTPTEGQVKIDGLNVLTDSLETRKRIGYLPENAPVYQDMRVTEYLNFVGNVRGLRGLQLQSRRDDVIQMTGLKDVVQSDIATLSKGFRQRVGLAQALLHDPPILILDEPTSGLDPNQIIEIRDVIRRIGKEKTVLLSTHILSEVEATTDRVIIISKGSIVADDTTADLQARQHGARLLVRLEIPEGTARKSISDGLQNLSGISRVTDVKGPSDQDWFGISTALTDDREVRRGVFQFAVAQRLTLMEMRREEQSLEAIFQNLTRSGGQ